MSSSPSLAQQLRLDLAREEAKADIRYFAETLIDITDYVNQYLDGFSLKRLNWHHHEWFDLIMNNKRVVVVGPRDHWKTTIFSVLFPLWRCLHAEKGYIFSNSQDQANKVLARDKYFLEEHWLYQGYKPENPTTWHKSEVLCTNGAQITAKGFGTAARGGHPHWIVVDDPLSENPQMSDDFVKRYFKRAITNMVAPGGWILVVGTPQRFADFLMELLQNEEYAARKYEAVLDWDTHEVLWPEYYSWERLMQRRAEIGELAFSQEFQCNPLDELSSLFPMRLLSACFDEESVVVYRYDPVFDCEYPGCRYAFYREEAVEKHVLTHGDEWKGRYLRPLNTFTGVDLAISTATGADYYAAVTLGVDQYQNRYILDVFREKGMPYRAQVDKLFELYDRYKQRLILVESNQYQRVIVDMARDLSAIPVREYITGYKKAHLEEGVPGLRVLFENVKFKLPRGDEESKRMMEPLLRELVAFGFVEGKVRGIGANDDTVMGLHICNEAVKQWEGTRLKYTTLEL